MNKKPNLKKEKKKMSRETGSNLFSAEREKGGGSEEKIWEGGREQFIFK
jgi:hypothetical protein